MRLALATVLFATSALAYEGRLIRRDRTPVHDAQVSVVGRQASTRTNAEGRFFLPGVEPPFTLIAIGARGQIYDPMDVAPGQRELVVEALMTETITVASGVAPNIAAPPAAATALVGREEIEQRTPEHLVDALARTAGIARRGEGPAAVPVVRGLAGGRTLILHDDARITAERRAGPSATFLDPFTLASIEVSRGPGSVTYGSDAFGGVVHARPRDPVRGEPGLRYHASATAGASDFRSGGLELTRDAFGGALLASIHARESDESVAGGGARIGNSAYSDRGAVLRLVRASDRSSWRGALTIDQGRGVEAPSADAGIHRTLYPVEDATRLTFALDTSPSTGLAVEVRAALGRYDVTTSRERLPAPGTTRQISSSEVGARDASMRAVATATTRAGRLQAGLDSTSRFGLHARGTTEHFDAAGASAGTDREIAIDDAAKLGTGIFATLDRQWTPALTITSGVRADFVRVRNAGGYFGDQKRDDEALSGLVAATAGPFRGVTMSLQIASGYREPTLSDRYFRGVSGRGFVIGNPALDPERSLQYDAAVRWSSGRSSVALYGYDYRITDLIERFRSGSDFRFRNRGKASVRGAELEASFPIRATLVLQANATLARGQAVEDGVPLDDISPPALHAALRWGGGRLSAFAHAFWLGADGRPGPVEVRRPSHHVIDAGVGWRLSSRLDLRLHATNVLDERYFGSADANAALAPGRAVSLAVAGTVGRQR